MDVFNALFCRFRIILHTENAGLGRNREIMHLHRTKVFKLIAKIILLGRRLSKPYFSDILGREEVKMKK